MLRFWSVQSLQNPQRARSPLAVLRSASSPKEGFKNNTIASWSFSYGCLIFVGKLEGNGPHENIQDNTNMLAADG